MLMARNVEPNGLPSLRTVAFSGLPLPSESVVLRRKSCVTATPMDANARDVRSHARNVRSDRIPRLCQPRSRVMSISG